jgi:hypothetical protein
MRMNPESTQQNKSTPLSAVPADSAARALRSLIGITSLTLSLTMWEQSLTAKQQTEPRSEAALSLQVYTTGCQLGSLYSPP